MVPHKFGEKLYGGLVTTMTSHLREISKSIEAAQGGWFLEELNRKWNDHDKTLHMIKDILMYMDRTYVSGTHKNLVHELGLNLRRDIVIHSSNIQMRLLNTFLELVHTERTSEVIDRGLTRNTMKMFVDLGPSVYEVDFEIPFLEASTEFYRSQCQKFIEHCDCGDYLKKAEHHQNKEIDRVSHYLDARSEKKITNVVERETITKHMCRLIQMENSGLVNILIDYKYEDMRRMYNLFRRIPDGLSIVKDVLISHIRKTGKQIVTDLESLKAPVEFVQRLLDEKDKYDKIINLAFNNDKAFQNALNSLFEYFMNLNTRSPEFISLFVDDKLQKGLKSVKRLLLGKTVSDDAERSLIVKLKTECGYQFTSKLEGMHVY